MSTSVEQVSCSAMYQVFEPYKSILCGPDESQECISDFNITVVREKPKILNAFRYKKLKL